MVYTGQDCQENPERLKLFLQSSEITLNPEIADLKNWQKATPIKYIFRKDGFNKIQEPTKLKKKGRKRAKKV